MTFDPNTFAALSAKGTSQFSGIATPASPRSRSCVPLGFFSGFSITAALFVAALMTVPARADVMVTRLDDHGRFATLLISGEILKSDVVRFERLVKTLRSGFDVLEVDLNSPGGNVGAALEIANLVRSEWLWTAVDDSDPKIQCASSCVYVFAAGAMRIAGPRSRIVIHRPYFDPHLFGKLPRNEARLKYDELSREVQTFLVQMGMSDSLFREMMKVPSNKGRMLKFSEMEAMNLVGKDPGYAEWARARNVVRFGESSLNKYEEWLERENAFSMRCRTNNEPAEFIRCSNMFEATDPNPLRRNSTAK